MYIFLMFPLLHCWTVQNCIFVTCSDNKTIHSSWSKLTFLAGSCQGVVCWAEGAGRCRTFLQRAIVSPCAEAAGGVALVTVDAL